LYHLAGVILMDKALDGERAIEALRTVLAVAPDHRDAFVRLRLLYDEMGEHDKLAALLTARLEVEQDPGSRIGLHRALADLHRNFLDDRDGACVHLRAVLEIDPNDAAAVALLSDIAWEQGKWSEAAETLIARARLEKDPTVLKHIFYRLGTIYADRLPDRRWALKSFQKVLSYDPNDEAALARIGQLAMDAGDWGTALGACERRIKVATTTEDKIACLHQVARIYADGLDDRARAEKAYRLALDLDPTSAGALSALIGYYRDSGDIPSMRVHLDRVAAPMRQRLGQSPLDGVAYRVLARALEAREQAGVKGSLATARCAAELAVLVGEGEEHEQTLAAPISLVRPMIRGLGRPEIDELLFPRSVSAGLRQIFAALGDRIGKQVGADVRRYGVGRGDRLKRNDDPTLIAIREVAAEMEVGDLDVYVSARDPYLFAIEATSPMSLIIGSGLAAAEQAPALRFATGRGLELGLANLSLVDRMNPDEFGVFLVALLRQFAPEFAPAGVDPAAVEAEAQRQRKLVTPNLVTELRPFAVGVAGAQFNHKRIWSGNVQGGHRAGLLASGSPKAAVQLLSHRAGYSDLARAATDPQIAELMRFAVSDDHAQLRAQLER
jgi:cellulose synthase operon protein C